jgi:hypothetical protein
MISGLFLLIMHIYPSSYLLKARLAAQMLVDIAFTSKY